MTGLLRWVQDKLPKTLKRLLVFEDFNDDLAAALSNPQFRGILQVNATRIADPRSSAAFALRKSRL